MPRRLAMGKGGAGNMADVCVTIGPPATDNSARAPLRACGSEYEELKGFTTPAPYGQIMVHWACTLGATSASAIDAQSQAVAMLAARIDHAVGISKEIKEHTSFRGPRPLPCRHSEY
jgi:hypothetical protein